MWTMGNLVQRVESIGRGVVGRLLLMLGALVGLSGEVSSRAIEPLRDSILLQSTEVTSDSLLDDTLGIDTLELTGQVGHHFLNNLDSMVNLWYVRSALDSLAGETAAALDDEVDTLSIKMALPDSVYMQRLHELNTLFELPYNSVVRNYIGLYTQKRMNQVALMLGLAEYYFPIFEQVLDQYGLPLELRILPIIESALNPRAVSRVGATGLWQFMYTTGKRYGLRIDSYVDERRDPMAASHAAAKFLRDLYQIYGDWTLVIAAYNCGPGNVNKAIRRSGGKRNYWDIYYYLPRETRGYVPAFIAANYAMNYASLHGITPMTISLPMVTDTVRVTGKLHLKQVAEVLSLPIDMLRDLNPQYKHDLLPTGSGHSLCLPQQQVSDFIDREAEIRAHNDSLYLLRPLFQEPTPRKGGSVDYYDVADAPIPANGQKVLYRVRRGDVLGAIAKTYRVSVNQLRAWNNIRRNLIREGQTLVIYVTDSKS